MIVLTLGGMNYGRVDRLDTALKGYSMAPGRERVILDYPQEPNAESVLTGVRNISAAIPALLLDDRVTVLASSQGAEVVTEWLYANKDRSDAPLRGDLSFILIGNPCRRLGGVVTSGSFVTRHGHLGRRRPTPECQYDIDDIARRGDTWANADGWPSGKRPRVGLFTRLLGRDPHINYQDVDIDECVLRERVGNTRYLVSE